MPLTPQITLTITLDDLSGVQLGSATNPAYIRIALSNYGPFLPKVSGTAMLAQVGPNDIPYIGAQVTVKLWGNDVITPVGTYYMISLLDAKKNVIQSAAYQFSGSGTFDISNLSQTFPVYSPVVIGSEVSVPFSATPTFDCTLVTGPVTFDLVLTGNVTSSVVQSPLAGQIITFCIQQDGTGSHTFTWPPNAVNPGIVNPAPNSKTVQMFVARVDGNLYPVGPQTWN